MPLLFVPPSLGSSGTAGHTLPHHVAGTSSVPSRLRGESADSSGLALLMPEFLQVVHAVLGWNIRPPSPPGTQCGRCSVCTFGLPPSRGYVKSVGPRDNSRTQWVCQGIGLCHLPWWRTMWLRPALWLWVVIVICLVIGRSVVAGSMRPAMILVPFAIVICAVYRGLDTLELQGDAARVYAATPTQRNMIPFYVDRPYCMFLVRLFGVVMSPLIAVGVAAALVSTGLYNHDINKHELHVVDAVLNVLIFAFLIYLASIWAILYMISTRLSFVHAVCFLDAVQHRSMGALRALGLNQGAQLRRGSVNWRPSIVDEDFCAAGVTPGHPDVIVPGHPDCVPGSDYEDRSKITERFLRPLSSPPEGGRSASAVPSTPLTGRVNVTVSVEDVRRYYLTLLRTCDTITARWSIDVIMVILGCAGLVVIYLLIMIECQLMAMIFAVPFVMIGGVVTIILWPMIKWLNFDWPTTYRAPDSDWSQYGLIEQQQIILFMTEYPLQFAVLGIAPSFALLATFAVGVLGSVVGIIMHEAIAVFDGYKSGFCSLLPSIRES